MVLLDLPRVSRGSSSSSGGAETNLLRWRQPSEGKENESPLLINASESTQKDDEEALLLRCREAVEEIARGVVCTRNRSSKLHDMLRSRVSDDACRRIKRVVRYMLLPCSCDLNEASGALRDIFSALHKLHLYAKLLSLYETKRRVLIEAYRKADINELQTIINTYGNDIFAITNTEACENVIHKCVYDNNIVFLSLFCSTESYSNSHQINQRNRLGESPLHVSCRILRLQAIRMLAELPAADFSAVNSKQQSCLQVFLESAVKAHPSSSSSAEQRLSVSYAMSLRGRTQHREGNLNMNCNCDLKSITATITILLHRVGPSSLLRGDLHGFDCLDYALNSRSVALFAPVLEAVAALDSERALREGAARVDWLRYLRAAVLVNDAYFVRAIAVHMLAGRGGRPEQYAQLLTLSVRSCQLTSLSTLLLLPEIAACANCEGEDGSTPIEAALRRPMGEGEEQLPAEAALRCLLRHGAKVLHKCRFVSPADTPDLARKLSAIDNVFTLCAAYGQADLLRALTAHGFGDAEPVVEPLPDDGGYYLGNYVYRSSPLAVSVAMGDVAMAELLLLSTPFRALVNTADQRSGLRPLHMALRGGSVAIVSLLLRHGAELGSAIAMSRTTAAGGVEGFNEDIDGVYEALTARRRGEMGDAWEDLARVEREFSASGDCIQRKRFYKIPFLVTTREHEDASRFLLLFYRLVRLLDVDNLLRHDNFSKWSKIYLKTSTLFSILVAFFRRVNLLNYAGDSHLLASTSDLRGIRDLLESLVAASAAGEDSWQAAVAEGDPLAPIVLLLSWYCATVRRYLNDGSLSVLTQLQSLPSSAAADRTGGFWADAMRRRQWPLLQRLLPLVSIRSDSLLEDSLVELLQHEGEQHMPECIRLLQEAISCGATLHSNNELLLQCVRLRAAASLLLLLGHGFYGVYSPQLWEYARALLPRGEDSVVRDIVDSYSEYLSHTEVASTPTPFCVSEGQDDLFINHAAMGALPADPRTLLLRALLRGGSAAALALAIEVLARADEELSSTAAAAARDKPLLFEVLSLAALVQTNAVDTATGSEASPSSGSYAGTPPAAEADNNCPPPPVTIEPSAAIISVEVFGGADAEREAVYRLAIERVRRGVSDQARLSSGARVGITYGGSKTYTGHQSVVRS